MTSDVTRVIDELYAVPPKEFSSARNATAASLKPAGHVKEAQAVRQLGKPSPSLWATNQLGRQDPEGVARFVDVVNRVRRSQLHDPRTAAEGMKTIRAELQALTNRAADVLTKAGYRISPATSARISNTVLAAAVDAGQVDDLRHGRLSAELAAPRFTSRSPSDSEAGSVNSFGSAARGRFASPPPSSSTDASIVRAVSP